MTSNDSLNEKQALLERLDNAREQLNAVLNRVSVQQEIYPTWTIKQLLAHIAGWDEACIAALEAFLAGEQPGTPALRGINYYNAQSVETRQTLDFDHIRREFEATRAQLKALIASVPDERIRDKFVLPWGGDGDMIQMMNIFIHHEIEHAEEIAVLTTKAEEEQTQRQQNPSSVNNRSS